MKALTFTAQELLDKNAFKNSIVAAYIPGKNGTHQLKLRQENTCDLITLINRTMRPHDVYKMQLPSTISAIENRELHWLGDEMDAYGSVPMVIISTSSSTTTDSMLDMEAPEEAGAECSLFPEIKPLSEVSIESHSLPAAAFSETQPTPEKPVKTIPWALIQKTAAEIRAGYHPTCSKALLAEIRQYLKISPSEMKAFLYPEAKVLWETEHPGERFGDKVEAMKTKILSRGLPGSRA